MKPKHLRAPPLPARKWAFFLDVDGTLLEIAASPSAVKVDSDLLQLLGDLQLACGGAMALVSGRSLSDLEAILRLPQLPMAGQHGMERRDAVGRLWLHATPPSAKFGIKEALAPVLLRHPGLLLEDKGLTLALHYRNAPHLAAYAQRLMRRLILEFGDDLEIQLGKRVVEVKPAGVDKGTAIAEFLAEAPFAGRYPVFIGDDLNDEHGFAEINRLGGMSIKVGRHASCAHFYLTDVAAVRHWLELALNKWKCET